MKKNETIVQLLLGVIFTILGTVFLIISVGFFVYEINFTKHAVLIQAVIIETYAESYTAANIDPEYMNGSTAFRYTVEGEEYISTVNVENSSWYIGQPLNIYVNNENPYKIQPSGFMQHIFSFVFAAVGFPFFLTGLGFLIYCKVYRSRKTDLLENGTKIWAVVTGYEWNRHVRLNGRHPIRLICTRYDPITKEDYIYRSGNCWEDGEGCLNKQVAIYISAADLKKYYIDADSVRSTSASD